MTLGLLVAQGQLYDVGYGQILGVQAGEASQLLVLWNGAGVARGEGQVESGGYFSPLLVLPWNTKESEKPAWKPGLWNMIGGGEWEITYEPSVSLVYNF